MFDPKTNRFPYPETTDRHYLETHMDRGIVFDANFPYIDRSPGFLFKQGVVRALLYCIVFPVCRIRLGLKVEGRENLKKYRDTIDNGILSVCNHVHMWDYLGLMSAVRPHHTNLLSWAPNINGENGTLIRMVGGIPIPENNIAGTKAYLRAVRDLLNNHGWLHIYAEGSMWEYYAPVRPFKRGLGHLAVLYNKPVLPLAYSFREPGWLRKNVFHQIATFTLRIGEPIYPNSDLPLKEREKDLTIRCHRAVSELTGADPDKNLYPPIFDDSRRVDYYTSVYGIGYKGSH